MAEELRQIQLRHRLTEQILSKPINAGGGGVKFNQFRDAGAMELATSPRALLHPRPFHG